MPKLGKRKESEKIAVLPLGATEYHGPHLPPETDAIIAEEIAQRVARNAQDDVLLLPVERIGYSPEHLDHPSTRSLTYDEAIERWVGIGLKQAKNGTRKLLLLNAHGGNSPLLTIVATELRVRAAMLCVATSWTRFDPPAGVLPENERLYGIHAGMAETSVMLALRPDLVDLNEARDFHNFQQSLTARNQFLRAYGKHAFGWKMADLNAAGAVGNAALASAETGEKLIANAVDGFSILLKEMQDFDLERFGQKKD